MQDQLVRAMTADGQIKAVAVTGRDLVEKARTIHTLLPVATAALGRTLLASSMMGDMLKSDQASLTLQLKGGGPLGTVLAVSDSQGNVRGYVQNPHVALMEKERGASFFSLISNDTVGIIFSSLYPKLTSLWESEFSQPQDLLHLYTTDMYLEFPIQLVC